MLNTIWLAMVLGAVICGALTGTLDAVAKACTDSAVGAVTLALGLVGVMTFWLGLVRVLQQGGVLRGIARLLKPVMLRLFPEVPADHPAMGMMILNMTSNVLGLGNVATPFGLKAMAELETLNPHKGTASQSMVTFLAINTSGLAVLPTGMIALRASLGSTAPGAIFFTTLVSTISATVAGITAAKLLGWMPWYRKAPPVALGAAAHVPEPQALDLPAELILTPPTGLRRAAHWLLLFTLVGAFGYALQNYVDTHAVSWAVALKEASSNWSLLILLVIFIMFGVMRGVPVYAAVVEGGREGFNVALRIIPYLVAILVGVGMLRASGGIDMMVRLMTPLTDLIGMPAEALPMALLRPLSGQGSYGVAAEIMKVHGPDSLVGQVVSTMMGSTETTFYVLALYLGAVNITRPRHTVLACLAADITGMLAAVWTCRLFLY